MDFISMRPILLEKIFGYSKTSVLLKCRLVSKLWAEEAARLLRKRGVTIAFRSVEDIEEYLLIPRPTSQIFFKFIVDVPSICPMLEDPAEEVHPQIVDLMECYREDIQDLKFWYQPLVSPEDSQSQAEEEVIPGIENPDMNVLPSTSGEIPDAIIFVDLLNLQLLSNYVQQYTNGQRPNSRHRIPKYFNRLSTPNLRSLTVQHLYDTECTSIVTSIIRSSGDNLEYLKIPAKPFPSIALNESISLQNLSELDLLGIFHGFSCANNETLDSIIAACPRLQKLGIEFSFRATLPKIQELFQALANSLVELRCTVQDRNLLARQIIRVNFIFPEMAKLTCLQMRWSNPGFIYYVDRLPALKELMLDTVWTRKIPGNIYPNGQPFGEGIADYKQLTSLKLSEIVNVEHVQAFAQYFPNLKMLGCSFDSNESLRLVYDKMSQLTNLIIERKSNVTEAGGICGLEEEELVKVNESVKSGARQNSLSLDRCLPYIGNLKELETLELCQLGVTWCSLQYGIINLPKLKTMVIQSRAFKKPNSDKDLPSSESEPEQDSFINYIAASIRQLRALTLWIRHTAERPSAGEITLIEEAMPYLDELNVRNHSLCGI